MKTAVIILSVLMILTLGAGGYFGYSLYSDNEQLKEQVDELTPAIEEVPYLDTSYMLNPTEIQSLVIYMDTGDVFEGNITAKNSEYSQYTELDTVQTALIAAMAYAHTTSVAYPGTLDKTHDVDVNGDGDGDIARMLVGGVASILGKYNVAINGVVTLIEGDDTIDSIDFYIQNPSGLTVYSHLIETGGYDFHYEATTNGFYTIGLDNGSAYWYAKDVFLHYRVR